MKEIISFLARHLSSSGPSQQTFLHMAKRDGELLEVKGVTPDGTIILK
jgi:hypothetical protein